MGVAVLDRWEGAAATAAGRGRPRGPGEGPAVPGAPGQERLCRLGEKPAVAVGQERLRGLGEGPSTAGVGAVGAVRDGVTETVSEQMPVACV